MNYLNFMTKICQYDGFFFENKNRLNKPTVSILNRTDIESQECFLLLLLLQFWMLT